MPKNITVTSVDSMSTKDLSNMTGRQKVKMVHEQEFEQYGIDPEKLYKDGTVMKPLKPEWIPEIILENINSTGVPRTYQNINKSEKTIVLSFESDKACENFITQFNANLFKTTNSFIRKQGKNPGEFNRIIVLETTVDGLSFTIRY